MKVQMMLVPCLALLGNSTEKMAVKLAQRTPVLEFDSSKNIAAAADCIASVNVPYTRKIDPTPEVIRVFYMQGEMPLMSYTITPRDGGSHVVFRRLMFFGGGKEGSKLCQ